MDVNKCCWGVVSGSYSDYVVHAVYLTKTSAEVAAGLANRLRNAGDDRYEVEDFPLGTLPRSVVESWQVVRSWPIPDPRAR